MQKRHKEVELSLHEVRCMILKNKMGLKTKMQMDFTAKEGDENFFIDVVYPNLKVKECTTYVKYSASSAAQGAQSADEICYCGQKLSCHLGTLDAEKRVWDSDYIEKFWANSFGKISFKDEDSGSRQPSQYVRLALEDRVMPIELMKLLKFWKLFDPYPDLAVAIIGGGKKFKLENKALDNFSHGLVKIASSTSAWTITEGHNYGLPRLVGRILREGQSMVYNASDKHRQKTRCIGFTPWGLVKDRENLIISPTGRRRTGGVGIKTGAPPDPAAKLRNKVIIDHLKVSVGMHTLAKPQKELYLNPDHSHFIFIDDGYRGQLKCSRETPLTRLSLFLNNLSLNNNKHGQSYLEKEGLPEMSKSIPSVIVVVNGGLRILTTLKNSVDLSVPIILCKNSGRAADIFVKALEIYNELKSLQNQNQSEQDLKLQDIVNDHQDEYKSVYLKIQKEFFPDVTVTSNDNDESSKKKERDKEKTEFKIHNLTKRVFDAVITRDDYITVFDLASDIDFDYAVLSALFKIRNNKIGPREQLNLALKWDRCDLAEEKIFSAYSNEDLEKEQPGYLESVMEKSLLESKLGFVTLLVNRGFSVNDYLTYDVLLKMYEESFESDKFAKRCFDNFQRGSAIGRRKMPKDKTEQRRLKMHRIFKFIASMIAYKIPDSFNVVQEPNNKENKHYSLMSEVLEDPSRELFIWAVMFNRPEMANFFWRKMDHPVMTATMGAYMIKAMLDRLSAYDEADDRMAEYLQTKEHFENLATDVINKCSYMDIHMTDIVLGAKHELYLDITCMDAAAQADCKQFLGSHVCQEVLNGRWQRKIRSNWLIICLAIIFFPLAPILVSFDFGQSMSSAIIKKISRLKAIYKIARVDDVSLHYGMAKEGHKSRATIKAELRWITLRRKYATFFKAPITKFCFGTMLEIFFLSLYCYVLIFAYHEQTPADRVLEYFLHTWVFTLLVEACRAIIQAPPKQMKSKVSWWLRQVFNCTDSVALLLYIIGFTLRMLFIVDYPGISREEVNFAAKCLFSFSLFLFICRLLDLLNVSTSLGPQLVMAGEMLLQTWDYLILLTLYLLAFGIYHSAIMDHKNLKTTYESFREILTYSWYPFIAGPEIDELAEADMLESGLCPEEHETCLANQAINALIANASVASNDTVVKMLQTQIKNATEASSTSVEPAVEAPFWFLSLWLLIWTLLSFLLMNLLIAIFSNIYDEIDSKSNEIWKFGQYQMITEYESKPILPPPLSIIDLLIRIFHKLVRLCKDSRLAAHRMKANKGNIENCEDETADDNSSNSRHIGNDPVLQFEREAQTAVYRDKKRAKSDDSVVQLDEIHAQLATIEAQVASLSRLESIAEQTILESKAPASNGTKVPALWRSVSKLNISTKVQSSSESASAPSPPVQSDAPVKVETPAKSLISNSAVGELEDRIGSLTEKLKSMQRCSDLLKEGIKSLNTPPNPKDPIIMQTSQMMARTTLPGPSVQGKPPAIPIVAAGQQPASNVNKAMLPIPGAGLTPPLVPVQRPTRVVSAKLDDGDDFDNLAGRPQKRK